MNRPTLARDIMTTKLVTLPPELDVFEAIGVLLKHRISGAPVIDVDGILDGVFSEKSSMNVLVEAAYDQLPTTKVYAFMHTDVRTISEHTDLLTIAQIFKGTTNRRLPVLRDGRLVGQVSRRDVLREVHKLSAVGRDRDTALLYLSSLMERSEAPIG